MPMTVTGQEGGVRAALSGEIDHHGAKSLMRELEDTVAQRLPTRLTLDLSGVTFMDSSGVALLLRARPLTVGAALQRLLRAGKVGCGSVGGGLAGLLGKALGAGPFRLFLHLGAACFFQFHRSSPHGVIIS